MRSLLLVFALFLALAAPAVAQDATGEGYSAEGPAVIDQTDRSAGPASPAEPAGDGAASLPFTGMDLVLVAAFGMGLLGVGAGMRRLTRPADPVSH